VLARPDSRLAQHAAAAAPPPRALTAVGRKRIRAATLPDGFLNPSAQRIIERMHRPQRPGLTIKYPLVPRSDLLAEQAEDARHDNPACKRQPCGYAVRGEQIIFGWCLIPAAAALAARPRRPRVCSGPEAGLYAGPSPTATARSPRRRSPRRRARRRGRAGRKLRRSRRRWTRRRCGP